MAEGKDVLRVKLENKSYSKNNYIFQVFLCVPGRSELCRS